MNRLNLYAVLGAVTLGAAGCFNPFSPTILTERITRTAPSPNTPRNAVRLHEWCWNNRGVEEYKELFTGDYVFISAGLDSAGNPSREIQARRDDEIQTAENMFIGSAERPPAVDISLDYDRNLVALPDTRPGKNAKWHQTVRTSVALQVKIDEGNTFEVTGAVQFYLVRGDSAVIPDGLERLEGDSLRWWIERWEDETIGAEGLRSPGGTLAVRGARQAGADIVVDRWTTLGEVKRYFLQRPAVQAKLAELRARSTPAPAGRRH